MGVSPSFFGGVSIEPPLSQDAAAELNARLDQHFEPSPADAISSIEDDPQAALQPLTIDSPSAPPSDWCSWRLSDDGRSLSWNGDEKFQHAAHWLAWLFEGNLAGRRCNGTVLALGDNIDWFDAWRIDVRDSQVAVIRYPVPWFGDERFQVDEMTELYVPNLVHDAVFVRLFDGEDGDQELRAFYGALTMDEEPIGHGVATFVRDLVQVGFGPPTWLQLLPT